MSVTPDNLCLENIIALDGTCEDNVSTSGLYSSSLGITPEFLSQIITKQYSGVTELYNAKKKLAIDIVANNIHSYYGNKYKVTSVVDNFKTGKFQENKVLMPAFAGYKGIYFELCSDTSYLDFYLSTLELFVNYSGTIPIKVIDLTQGKVLETINVTTVAGEIKTVYPSSTYVSRKRKLSLFIGYDATGIQSYKTLLKTSSCSSCGPMYRMKNTYETIQSSTILLTDPLIQDSVKSISDTGGLSLTHSLNCNHRDWLCSISNQIAYPVLYKTASLLFQVGLTESPNDRNNTTIGSNFELLQKRYDMTESDFEKSMNTLFATMNPPNDERCFSCKPESRHAIILP